LVFKIFSKIFSHKKLFSDYFADNEYDLFLTGDSYFFPQKQFDKIYQMMMRNSFHSVE